MKTLYRISIFLNIVSACFILVKGSELFTKDYLSRQRTEPVQETQPAQMQKSETASGQKARTTDSEKHSAAAVRASATEQLVTCDTAYIVTSYDISTQEEVQEMQQLPSTYIGKNRQQLVSLIEDYNKSASLQDMEEGFVSLELESFSVSEIRVRKVIESVKEITPVYYGCIIAEDGFLTVYDEKREQVILYTDIPFFSLQQEQQQEILDGKYIETQEQLYNLLESYSS